MVTSSYSKLDLCCRQIQDDNLHQAFVENSGDSLSWLNSQNPFFKESHNRQKHKTINILCI